MFIENDRGDGISITYPEDDQLTIINPARNDKKNFEFERVYTPDSTQSKK